MSESQSRYSIVERLTNTKLEILDNKANIAKDISRKRSRLLSKENELASWERTFDLEFQREKEIKESDIIEIRAELEYLEATEDDTEKAYDLKIVEINKALARIEEISKSAQEASQ